MRYLLLASLVAACSGCIIAVKDDGSPPADEPPPPPAAAVVEGGPPSESFMLRYDKDVPEIYEGIRKVCEGLRIRITDTNKPGSGNNWTLKGYHETGRFDLQVYLYRRSHKSQTTVTVTSGRFSAQECHEWTRRIHSEIGKQIGEEGRD
jgi:hypothetical protein